MSAPASKIKVQGGKTLYFLAKILYITHRDKPKELPHIIAREVFNLAVRIRAEQARA
jgi:hypothetical protein